MAAQPMTQRSTLENGTVELLGFVQTVKSWLVCHDRSDKVAAFAPSMISHDAATPTRVARRAVTRVILLGLVAFAVLAIRFSPNWAAVYHGATEAKLSAPSPAERAMID